MRGLQKPEVKAAHLNHRRMEGRAINIIYFDLETKRTLGQVGGRENVSKLGMAAAVTYSAAKNAYHRYTEARVKALIEELKAAELVIGYNVLEFDYEVLRAYTGESLDTLPTLDLMHHLAERLGFRPSLESVATATLGVSKSADGLQAVRWYRKGQIDKVLDYCEKDVEILKRLHEYGKHHRIIYYWDRQYQRQMVVVNW